MSTLRESLLDMEICGSMRSLMTAGPALARDNVAGYNCAYLPIDHPRAFDELMYILLCGTGVGFSVERQYIQKLPEVPSEFTAGEEIIVPDSKIGWADSFRRVLASLFAGEIPTWDTSRVRPAGTPLKTFGGRASGPQPLIDLFTFACELFQEAGREEGRLTDLQAHDLCCKIGDVVVVGGVRRSALISLSNPTSQRLSDAKSGDWRARFPYRQLANNSACYTTKPDFHFFLKEMESLYTSYSGERGIFSRPAAQKIAARNGRRDADVDFGTNPCSEIILRPNQFCNLSEVVVRAEDSFADLKDKVRKATILGTLQATLTDFRYLRPIWQKNTEEEALLGVSLTGIWDHKVLSGRGRWSMDQDLAEVLRILKEVAIETNKEWAEKLGINQSAAITCVKPSGTVSQLVNSSSGINPRHSPMYIRRVRGDLKDPLSQYMRDAGVPCEEAVDNPNVLVFSFPVQGPENSPSSATIGAMEQLKLWKVYQDHWCEHKPSTTIMYRDDEFLDMASWIWKNFDSMSGIAMLPYDGGKYEQAPYETIDAGTFDELEQVMPTLDWSKVVEESDVTTSSQEFACVGGACEIK